MKSLERQTTRYAWLLLISFGFLAALPLVTCSWSKAIQADTEFTEDFLKVAMGFEDAISADLHYGGELTIWEPKVCASLLHADRIVSCRLVESELKKKYWLSTNDRIFFQFQSFPNDSLQSRSLFFEVDFASQFRRLMFWVPVLFALWLFAAMYFAKKIAHRMTDIFVIRHIRQIQESLASQQSFNSEYEEVTAVLSEIEAILKKYTDAERRAAIASMVGAITHDVRKPFSLFKAVLDGIKQTKNPADLKEFAAMTLPEVERAMQSVDGLLTDVLQVSSTSNELVLENLNVARFVDACYLEIFRAQPEADVHIESKIDASLAISADETKLKRVFLNIIGNACQAIQWKGRIWVHARAQKGRVYFILGNAGSFIPAESLPQLFEAFFTSGKKGGTGLGLAIAKKWTEAHGGRISCTSFKDQANPNGVVEFHFDIAEASSAVAPFSDLLPAHSSGYRLEFTFGKSDADAATQPLAQELAAAFGSHEIRVAAIDDEPAYLKSIESVLGSLNQAGNLKLQTHAKGFSENLLHSLSADLYILDYDLGLPDLNGLDLIRAYRSAGGTGHICLHTNRADSETSRAAIEAGANTVYPKPIDAKHLVNLLKEVASKRDATPVPSGTSSKPQVNRKPRIALVEDSFVMRLGWRGAIANDCELSEFKSPEEFFAKPDAKYDLVITDMNFDNSQNTGVEVARFAHQNAVSGTVFLSSNGHYEDPEKLFAQQLDKNQTYSVDDLMRMVH